MPEWATTGREGSAFSSVRRIERSSAVLFQVGNAWPAAKRATILAGRRPARRSVDGASRPGTSTGPDPVSGLGEGFRGGVPVTGPARSGDGCPADPATVAVATAPARAAGSTSRATGWL